MLDSIGLNRNMELGARIKAWLGARRMTQRDLALSIDMSPAVVSYWVKGRCSPSNASLGLVVEALGLTMERFYGRVPKSRAAA